MRVAIFGAGAVGAYVGGRLAQAGVPVAFLARGDRLHALASALPALVGPDTCVVPMQNGVAQFIAVCSA